MTLLFSEPFSPLLSLLFSWSGAIQVVLWIALVASMLLLIAVILLQEGKGGGLAEAFGGVGAETFGVKAHGINKFTAGVGAVFLVLCILLVKLRSGPDTTPIAPDAPQIPRPAQPIFPPPDNDPPGTLPGGGGAGQGGGTRDGAGGGGGTETPPPDRSDGK